MVKGGLGLAFATVLSIIPCHPLNNITIKNNNNESNAQIVRRGEAAFGAVGAHAWLRIYRIIAHVGYHALRVHLTKVDILGRHKRR